METGVTESFKKKLIVIGNGMAGARTLEEILARGGADQFEITVVGDEPYGNYNRLLLSSVLNGSQDPSEIFLNGLDWYVEHGIALRAGVRVDVIDRPQDDLLRRWQLVPIRQTHNRHWQPPGDSSNSRAEDAER